VQDTAVIDPAVQDLALATQETEVLATFGRHRAAPSAGRRAALRMSMGAGGVVLAVVLGWAAATSMSVPVPAADPLPTLGAYEPAQPEPTSRPAPVDRAVEPSTPSAPPTTTAAVPSVEAPPPAPVASTAAPSLPTVRPGDRCAVKGEVGMTEDGEFAVCVGRGNGRTRWREA
jgi:hypothetical protein